MPFTYDILHCDDSFRILNLLPSQDTSSELQLTLETTNLRSNPHYEAVSYTWADENGCSRPYKTISCGNTRMVVTANCEATLRRLRSKTCTRALWLDAICINQHAVKERGHQVSLMRSIYGQAAKVIIYLGAASNEVASIDGTPVSCLFQDYLARMAAVPARSLYEDLTRAVATYVLHGTISPLAQGFLNVTGRPWWGRIWVIQEAISARSAIVMCGDKISAYTDFVNLYTLLLADHTHNAGLTWSTLEAFKHHLMTGTEIMRQCEQGDILQTLRVVLPSNRRLKATDPRDYINGIYGVLTKISPKCGLPLPDYHIQVDDLFVEVNTRLIASLGLGFVLAQVARVDKTNHLPSWCVDWSTRPQHHIPSSHINYRASSVSKARYSFSCDGKELFVTGIFVDVVQKLPKVDMSAYEYPYNSSRAIFGYRQSCLVGMSMNSHLSIADREGILWRTMCWNVDGQFSYPEAATIANSFRVFHRIISSGESIRDIEQELLTQAAPFNDVAVHSMPLCSTRNGLLGSVPPTAEVGDQIALVTGSQLPLVFRHASGSYHLIGACYVHGLMNGEAFPGRAELLTRIRIR